MRSNEVAKAADVSVRTLRHYHDLGLLPEPPRSANGYRDYSALDVARVLRIKRLSSLGFSLADIAQMDAAEGEGTTSTSAARGDANLKCAGQDGAPFASSEDAMLAALDAELERKIEALQQQRRTIARLRAERLDPALPANFAHALKLFYGDGERANWSDLSESDRAALVLAGHLYDEEDAQRLAHFAQEAERLGTLEQLQDLDARIASLPADATEREQDALVEEALALLEPLLGCFDPSKSEGDDAAWRIFDDLMNATQNPAQKQVNDRIEEAIAARMRALAKANA